MPAAWQKWMPIYIQRLKSNPYVIAMHPAAVTGYLWLVMEQWQSEDCTLTNNVKELKIISSLGMYWADYADEILDRFGSVNGDRLRNDTCYELWMEAKAKYEEGQLQYEALKEQRSRYGKHGAEVREARRLVTNHARHKQDLSTPEAILKQDSSQADAPLKQDLSIADAKSCFTDTYTVTNTKEKKKPSGKPETDHRHPVFHEHVNRYWKHKTGEERAPWDGSEGKALSALLAAKPDLTLEQFRLALKHRGDSPDEVQTERPRQWLPNILRFAGGPLDRYGKPLQVKVTLPNSGLKFVNVQQEASR